MTDMRLLLMILDFASIKPKSVDLGIASDGGEVVQ